MPRDLRAQCLIVVLCVASAALAQTAPSSQPVTCPQLKEVVVVFKTHFDIGYTDTIGAVLEKYRTTMIDQALSVCDATRELPADQQFVWTIPGWPLARILGPAADAFANRKPDETDPEVASKLFWSLQTPERRARIQAAMRDGRIVWHALPFTTHTESLELEDLVRGLEYSSALSRSMSMPLPVDAKMTDVPSHVWSLATILSRAGIEFFHLGVNAASQDPDVPRLFWWEGPDGSRLLTMVSAEYGTGLVPPADWPYPVWLALIHTGDNKGPPTPEDVRKLLAEAAEKLPGVKVRFGRLGDFAESIRKQNPRLPIVRADMPDTWIHGLMSMPIETGEARSARPALAGALALNTLLRLWERPAPPSFDRDVDLAYEQSLLYGEHTWGISYRCFSPRLYGDAWRQARAEGKYASCEQSWAEHGVYARHCRSITDRLRADAMRRLAESIQIQGPRLVVFNPLPWRRNAVVSIPAAERFRYGVVDAKTGVAEVFQADDERLSFIATNLPPMGYRTYKPGISATPKGILVADAATHTLENDRLALRIDERRGTIVSLFDKRTGRELVDSTAKYGLGQYLYERCDGDQAKAYFTAYVKERFSKSPWAEGDFGKPGMPPASQVPYAAASPEGFNAEYEAGAVCASVTLTAPAGAQVPHPVTLKVTIYRDMPYVDLAWSVADKQADPWPEAGWLCLPFKIDQPRFNLGRLGCVVDPAKNLVKRSNHDVFCVNTGLTITGPNGKGVGLCPIDSPVLSLDRPGLWRFSPDFVPTRPIAFVNLFNNQWSTNFAQWIEGSWTSRVRLWAVEREGLAGDLMTPAWEARADCAAATFDGPPGTLPPGRPGLEFSRDGLVVTTFGPNPDGQGLVLRLWEHAGSDEPCRVRFPIGFTPGRVQLANLRGQPLGDPLKLQDDGSCLLPMTHFAPTTVLIDASN